MKNRLRGRTHWASGSLKTGAGSLRTKVKLEASGGINEKNISSYAKTGVDMISVGAITNSPKGIDFSLEI